ncbi:MAG: 6-carboxytetrahydropterin synthase QueD [Bdellovibrionales bacterium]
MSEYELRKTLTLEAAHLLPNVPAGHKCGRLHGHSFRVTLVVRGTLDDKTGWVMDYTDIKKAAQPLIDQLDHHYLNEIKGLENPTSEVLSKWIFEKLNNQLKGLYQVIVAETCTTESRYPTR